MYSIHMFIEFSARYARIPLIRVRVCLVISLAIDLANNNIDYVTERRSTGTGPPVDVFLFA